MYICKIIPNTINYVDNRIEILLYRGKNKDQIGWQT